MTENETIEYVDKMSLFEKSRIYGRYYVNMLSLKYNFKVFDLQKTLHHHGMGNPDKKFKEIAFYYLWKDLKIKTFEQFCDKSNVIIHDVCVADWEERGFASKSWVVFDINSIFNYVRLNIV